MRKAEPIAGLGGLLLLGSLFLRWYDVNVQTPEPEPGVPAVMLGFASDGNGSAWAVFSVIDVLLALIALLAIAVPLMSAFAHGPAKPVAIAVIASTLTPLAVLLVLFRIVFPPAVEAIAIDDFGFEISLTPALGAWLSLAGALIAWIGSWLSLRDESTPGAEPPDLPRRPAPPPTAA